ncbi:MAG: right-handed parallel beta-helix repeat-containing protein, partial [Planctomycetales bacterium]|nr:right-handed parallel beta-helix repeat-containing protein [Planctomycetales bacterium]
DNVSLAGNGQNVALLGNRIYNSGELGIDLNDDGVTLNDGDDADAGSNGLQNFPSLADVVTSGSTFAVSGSLNTEAERTYRIEFFASESANPSGFGEGQRYLGYTNVTTDANGAVDFHASLVGAIDPDEVLTATATEVLGGGYGGTSEFAQAVSAVAGGHVVYVDTAADASDGDTSSVTALLANRGADGKISLREAIVATNNTGNVSGWLDEIRFAISESDPWHYHYVDNSAAKVTWGNAQAVSMGGMRDVDYHESWFRIDLASALPTVTDGLIVNGYSQAGARANSQAEMDPTDAVIRIELYAHGLGGTAWTLAGEGSELRGVNINGYTSQVLLSIGANNITVGGSYFGTDISGTIDSPSGRRGVQMQNGTSGTLIGGPTTADRNIISGNYWGITEGGTGTIQGNFIGTDKFGTSAIGNGLTGIAGVGGKTVIDNVISGNGRDGLEIDWSSNFVIEGNKIGTDVTGTVDLGNGRYGIDGTQISNGVIRNNIISGNAAAGLMLNGSSVHDVVVQGNYVGTDITGEVAIPNGYGIDVIFPGTGVVIGGVNPGEGNLLSGNSSVGLFIRTNNEVSVFGNTIGASASGSALPNAQAGIRVLSGSTAAVIGGNGAGEGNVIAFNNGPGIQVDSNASTGNTFIGNSIYGNLGLGIDINGDGVTPNDLGDVDTGPNDLQNFPVLATAAANGSAAVIGGSLTSTPNRSFRVEFFASDDVDGDGFGEGQRYLGFTTVMTGADGVAEFSVSLSGDASGGDWITATATEDLGGGLYGGTSEFSMAVQAVEASIITVDTTAHTRDGDTSSIAALFADRGADGRISLREAIEAANNTANVGGGPDLIRFDLSTSDSGFVDPDGIVGNADDYWRIQPTSQFTITDAVVIDGFSQAGSMMGDLWAGTPHEIKVEIDGSQTNTRGFVISSAGSGSTIRGLAIHSAMTNNIQVNGQSTIEANYVGLTANGDDAPGHRGTATTSANILVNGSVSAGSQLLDNVVAGAWNKNIRIGTANGANGVIVQGNFVGVDPTGMSRAPGAQTTNGTYGIILRDGVDDVVIGGS